MRGLARAAFRREQIAHIAHSHNRAVKKNRVKVEHFLCYLAIYCQFFKVAVREVPYRDTLDLVLTGRLSTLKVNICLRCGNGVISRLVHQIVGAVFVYLSVN